MIQNNDEIIILINSDSLYNQNNNNLNNLNYNNNMIISNNHTIRNFNNFEYECLIFYHRQGYLMFNYFTSILFIFIVNHQYIDQFKNSNNLNLIYYNQTLINTNNNNYYYIF
mgnify:CR=1 FL=1